MIAHSMALFSSVYFAQTTLSLHSSNQPANQPFVKIVSIMSVQDSERLRFRKCPFLRGFPSLLKVLQCNQGLLGRSKL